MKGLTSDYDRGLAEPVTRAFPDSRIEWDADVGMYGVWSGDAVDELLGGGASIHEAILDAVEQVEEWGLS